jgi:hypothetical protein
MPPGPRRRIRAGGVGDGPGRLGDRFAGRATDLGLDRRAVVGTRRACGTWGIGSTGAIELERRLLEVSRNADWLGHALAVRSGARGLASVRVGNLVVTADRGATVPQLRAPSLRV